MRSLAFFCLALALPGFANATPFPGFLSDPQSPGNPAFFNPTVTGDIAHFLGSENCGSCHDSTVGQCSYLNKDESCVGNGSPLAYIDNDGKDVSIRKAWSATMMGNAARDPYWRAKVRKEVTRHPELKEEVNETCSVCHAPMANVDAKAELTGNGKVQYDILDVKDKKGNVTSQGILSMGHIRHDLAMDGVSCSVCHQIKDGAYLGTQDANTGGYQIDTTLVGANRLMFGPYANADIFPGPMKNNQAQSGALRATPTYSAHISQSKVCGTCHDVKTPIRDTSGTLISTGKDTEFPEQMPYTEWFNSDFNTGASPQTCQQCHMARTNGVYISTQPAGTLTTSLKKKDNFAIHEFVGGNRLMLDIFNNNKTQLGILSDNFDATMAATSNMLNSAATLTQSKLSGKKKRLRFTLRVNSETGHKLPSAYPSRRVILHVMVKDAGDNVVWESGKVNEDGSVTGVPDRNPKSFEPHYDLITNRNQVQVYESVMADYDGVPTHILFNGAQYVKDNRIPPKGFDKAIVPSDIQVVGDAQNDPNFIGGSDDVTYQVGGLPPGRYTIQAELIYQSVSFPAIFDLTRGVARTAEEIIDFKSMFDASSEKSQIITTSNFNLSNIPADIDADGDVDQADIDAIQGGIGQIPEDAWDMRDVNSDLLIDTKDVRRAKALCTRAACATE